jgi:hypothetical protein
MARSHSHYPGITCTGPLTKAQCDLLWTQYMHGHEGAACVKEVLPGNVKASCVLGMTAEQLESRRSKTGVAAALVPADE